MLLNWERIAFRTVYVDGATPIPVGVPVLGFTSLAMHRAVRSRCAQSRASSERAAVVAAAYQVLQHYYPQLRAKLQADRAASLDARGAGTGQALRRQGREAGRRVASSTSRPVTATSTRPSTTPSRPAPGVWQPAPPATDMLAAWLGSLRHAGDPEDGQGRRPGRPHQQRLHHAVRGGEEPGPLDLDHAHRGPEADGAVLQLQLSYHGR